MENKNREKELRTKVEVIRQELEALNGNKIELAIEEYGYRLNETTFEGLPGIMLYFSYEDQKVTYNHGWKLKIENQRYLSLATRNALRILIKNQMVINDSSEFTMKHIASEY